MASAHPGFQNVAGGIAAKEGVPLNEARAMLAATTRKASAKAKAKNPRLKRVKSKKKLGGAGGISGVTGRDGDQGSAMRGKPGGGSGNLTGAANQDVAGMHPRSKNYRREA